MGARGRQSGADIALSVSNLPQRPDPPEHFQGARLAVWEAVVNAMPADWFGPETLGALESYCVHLDNSQVYTAFADQLPPPADHNDVKHHKDLRGIARDESKAANAFERSLRLTKQARVDAAKAHRQSKPQTGFQPGKAVG